MPFKLGPLELLLMIPGMLIGLALYFLPTILANVRHRPNTMVIFLINFLLGWTAIGWIAALIMVFIEPSAIISTGSKETPVEIAKQRYAKGEISKDEFEEIKKNIS